MRMQDGTRGTTLRAPNARPSIEQKSRIGEPVSRFDGRNDNWFSQRRGGFRDNARIPLGGVHYRGDHVAAGFGNGRDGFFAYYHRDKDRYRHHGYPGHGHHWYSRYDYDPWYTGAFYHGRYYPYGYSSYHDSYYYRYPYNYVSLDYYPRWTVYVDPVETVYVESPSQQVVYVETQSDTQAGQSYPSSETVIVPESSPPPGTLVPQPSTPTPYQPMEPGLPGQPQTGDSGQSFYDESEGAAAGPDTQGPDTQGKVQIEVEPQERIPINNALLADAARSFQEGRYEDAKAYLARAVLNDPQNGFAELAYALGHFAVGDYQPAAAAVRRGLASVPDIVDAPLDIVRQYGEPKDFEMHMQALQLYVASHPDDQNAWFLMGYVLYSSGHPEKAASAFAKAAKLDPSDTYAAVLHDAVKRVRVEP